MLSRYSHVRMEAKRRALDEIAARQRAADENAGRKRNGNSSLAVTSQSAVVQQSPAVCYPRNRVDSPRVLDVLIVFCEGCPPYPSFVAYYQIMGFEWLLIVALIVLLARAIMRRNREAPHAGTASKPLGKDTLISPGHGSGEFVKVLKEIEALGRDDSPQLERVRDLGRLLGCVYPSCITGLQQRQIEAAVPQALVGKQVSWKLKVNDVGESGQFFLLESKDMGGFWVQHVEGSPLLVAECQTFERDVLYLQRGRSVIASGRIAGVKIQWPSLLLMVADAAISGGRDDPTISPEAVDLLGTETTSSQQQPSVGSQFQTLHLSSTASAGEPSYQTAPLTEYSRELRERAGELFELVSQQIGHRAKRYKGSFSISANSSSETAAKIVIYQRGLGRENGEWPPLADGVYVLVRCNGGAGRLIWEGDLLRSSAYHQRLDPERTLGIAPMHNERFAYFRLEPEDQTRAVAEMLVICASA